MSSFRMLSRMPRAASVATLGKLIHDALPAFGVELRPRVHGADFLDRSARAAVVRADHEDHPVDRLERVREHEPLHLAVVRAAPAASCGRPPQTQSPPPPAGGRAPGTLRRFISPLYAPPQQRRARKLQPIS